MASFLGTANILDGAVARHGFRLSEGTTIPVPASQLPANGKVVFRPQNVHFADRAVARPGHTLLEGTVTHSEFLGSMVRYGVRIGTNEVLVDIAHQAGSVPLGRGDAVRLELDHLRAMVLAQ